MPSVELKVNDVFVGHQTRLQYSSYTWPHHLKPDTLVGRNDDWLTAVVHDRALATRLAAAPVKSPSPRARRPSRQEA